jgi:excisionase family DNA binding protein
MEVTGEEDTIAEKTILTRREAADYLGFKYNTLAVWSWNRRYDLKTIKVGRSIRYRKSDLDEFLRRNELAD